MALEPPVNKQEGFELHKHRLSTHLPSLYYLSTYLSAAEEAVLLSEILSSKAGWKQISGRRLQSYGGQLAESSAILVQSRLPRPLQALTERLAADLQLPDFGLPNHVLANWYKPGQGIMPHEDGPAYAPCTCIVSLGGSAKLDFYKKLSEGGYSQETVASVFLEPQSLLVFTDDAYTTCLHGIAEATSDTVDTLVVNAQQLGLQMGSHIPRASERLSLTVRRVLRVRKNLIRL